MEYEIANAVIESTSITNGDHGVLVVWLHLKYSSSSGQGFGGYCLYNPTKDGDVTGLFIWRCMEVAGVSSWEDITGRPIRVKHNHERILAIGHLLEDVWFNPSKELKEAN